jgi:PilZ domain
MNLITSVRATDRRGSPRVAYPFDGSCSGLSGRRAVRIGDLSVSGCFVESIEATAPGERIELRIDIPDRAAIELAGEVVYTSPPVGFGVRFVNVPHTALAILQAAIESLLPPDRR